MPVLRYSMIYLNPASVPLGIPLGILPTPLESALACPPSRNSFIRNTYKAPSQVLLLKDLNPFRCNTYRKSVRNSFRSNTYKKHRGYPISPFFKSNFISHPLAESLGSSSTKSRGPSAGSSFRCTRDRAPCLSQMMDRAAP